MSVPRWTEVLPGFEGRSASMYADSGSIVTVGVGHALQSAADAVTVFGGDPQAAIDWASVKALPPGHLPAFYAGASTVRLTDTAIDALLAADVARFTSTLARLRPSSKFWPDGPRDAALDIFFNTGKIFQRMAAAMDIADWQTAANESFRIERPSPNGIQPARNAWARAAILDALTPAQSVS